MGLALVIVLVVVLVLENGLSAPIASEEIQAHALGHFARKAQHPVNIEDEDDRRGTPSPSSWLLPHPLRNFLKLRRHKPVEHVGNKRPTAMKTPNEDRFHQIAVMRTDFFNGR